MHGKRMGQKLILVWMMLMLALSAAVGASMLIPASGRAIERAKAPDRSPVISETDSGNWELSRTDFVYYARPDKPGGSKGPKRQKSPSCYELLNVRWKGTPVLMTVNPDQNNGLSNEVIIQAIKNSAETWDKDTTIELFNDEIIIDGSVVYGKQDYENVISFGEYSDPEVLAVTTIWHTKKGKEIVEFDILFNNDYSWGDAETDPLSYDLQSVLTHELGHSFGLDDVYQSSCSDVTMYGYYTGQGETKKRTLENQDITGLQRIYGL